jgi:hypothetical protein
MIQTYHTTFAKHCILLHLWGLIGAFLMATLCSTLGLIAGRRFRVSNSPLSAVYIRIYTTVRLALSVSPYTRWVFTASKTIPACKLFFNCFFFSFHIISRKRRVHARDCGLMGSVSASRTFRSAAAMSTYFAFRASPRRCRHSLGQVSWWSAVGF